MTVSKEECGVERQPVSFAALFIGGGSVCRPGWKGCGTLGKLEVFRCIRGFEAGGRTEASKAGGEDRKNLCKCRITKVS